MCILLSSYMYILSLLSQFECQVLLMQHNSVITMCNVNKCCGYNIKTHNETVHYYYIEIITVHLTITIFICLHCVNTITFIRGYGPAGLSAPLPQTIEDGFIFLHRCLVPPKNFPQRKSGFCRRYSH